MDDVRAYVCVVGSHKKLHACMLHPLDVYTHVACMYARAIAKRKHTRIGYDEAHDAQRVVTARDSD